VHYSISFELMVYNQYHHLSRSSSAFTSAFNPPL
jgi:hypothetical protein